MIAQTRRKGIEHFEKLSVGKFVEIALSLLKEKRIKASVKVDGAGVRFGKDAHGNFFFESSKSGIVTQYGHFKQFALANDRNLTLAMHYDEMFKLFKQSPLWKALPPDTKIVGEILYNPLASVESGERLKFVTIAYPKKYLGEVATFIPFTAIRASTGESLSNANEILDNLIKMSNNKLKVLSADIGHVDFDVEALLEPLKKTDAEELTKLVKSRKKEDVEKKALLIELINDIKLKFVEAIRTHKGLNDKIEALLGKDVEGLVIEVGERKVKIVTAQYTNDKFGN